MSYSHAETNALILDLFKQGEDAFNSGKTRGDNPYPPDEPGQIPAHHSLWNQGFRRGERKAES